MADGNRLVRIVRTDQGGQDRQKGDEQHECQRAQSRIVPRIGDPGVLEGLGGHSQPLTAVLAQGADLGLIGEDVERCRLAGHRRFLSSETRIFGSI